MATGKEMLVTAAVNALMKAIGVDPDEAKESFLIAQKAIFEAVQTTQAIKAQLDRIEAALAKSNDRPQPWGNFGGFSAIANLEDDALIAKFPVKQMTLRAIPEDDNAASAE
jgi:hypothetical protein